MPWDEVRRRCAVEIDPFAAAVAGLVAAQCMEVPAYTQRAMGLGVRQDIFAESGSILRAPRRLLRPVGWLGHGLLAMTIVLLYSTFFAAVGNNHLAWWGIVAGAVHGGLGGIVIGAWPDLHPDIPEHLLAPGVFYRHYGHRDVVTFCVAQLIFGLVAGTLYAVLHSGLPVGAVF
jgi:hypothetical protein